MRCGALRDPRTLTTAGTAALSSCAQTQLAVASSGEEAAAAVQAMTAQLTNASMQPSQRYLLAHLRAGLRFGDVQMASSAFRQLRKSLAKAAAMLTDAELASLLLLIRCGGPGGLWWRPGRLLEWYFSRHLPIANPPLPPRHASPCVPAAAPTSQPSCTTFCRPCAASGARSQQRPCSPTSTAAQSWARGRGTACSCWSTRSGSRVSPYIGWRARGLAGPALRCLRCSAGAWPVPSELTLHSAPRPLAHLLQPRAARRAWPTLQP